MKNVEASIRARLTQKAKERGITFQYASILYMQEGLLVRIAGSAYATKLILKADVNLDRIPDCTEPSRRMKDLYDLWFILEHVPLSYQEILSALRATFVRRRTDMPEGPAVFSRELADSERTELLWKGFTRRSKLGDLALSSILDIIKTRLEPLYSKMRLMQD